MKMFTKGLVVALGAAMMVPSAVKAQNEFNVSGKADFVTDYIWRGADQQTGFAVQPSLTLSYAGFTLNAWGSTPLDYATDKQEFDINLSYSYKGLTVTVSDLWWAGRVAPYGYYDGKDGNVDAGHHFEGTVAYNFGEKFPLTLSWSTWFAGADAVMDGTCKYSTYINASYVFNCPGDVTLVPSVGFTPWDGYYSADNAAFTDISLKASKDLKVTDSFSIPLFVQAIVSPEKDHTYLVGGFSLGF